ncbi:transcription-repair coupling factor [Emcibacter sp.]|uniref:transcription-repair coupling factor n=1 Tax=Emcibacter sp. TaxID=1979954 RepID=UPI003A9108D9
MRDQFIDAEVPLLIANTPEGMDALFLAQTIRETDRNLFLHIARDDGRLANMAELIAWFAPELEILTFPAWDCLPYDRVSPNHEIVAERMIALSRLARLENEPTGRKILVLTSVNAAGQRLPERRIMRDSSFLITPGSLLDIDKLSAFLSLNGYSRASSVMEHGDFAVRGGLVDIYPPGFEDPVRIDLFGDEVDVIREFDALSQRSGDKVDKVALVPMSEVFLDETSIRHFRARYVAEFGTVLDDDPLYEAVTEGRKHQGMEHWLPLFHEKLETLFDYLPDCPVTLDHLGGEALDDRNKAIEDYYQARQNDWKSRPAGSQTASVYKPLPPALLYLDEEEWQTLSEERCIHRFSPYASPPDVDHMDLKGKIGRDFAPERNNRDINVYDALRKHVVSLVRDNRKVLIASYSLGARDRLSGVLKDHGMGCHRLLDDWAEVEKLPEDALGLIILPLEHGFETDSLAIVAEQDILGDRLIRKARRSRKAENFLTEASALTPGDLVIHMDHGVGRYEGLKTLDVGGAAHDCVMLTYQGGDKLYVPVENIEVLSRYSSEGSDAQLDKLGGTAWQGKKARLKKKLLEMADELIKLAAERELRKGSVITPPEGLYEEFCARFPYNETDDQLRAIQDVIDDLGSGRPMDRLVCGDVGFGKTEVALRAAFLAAMNGFQVAIVAPTTLLARQHYKNFTDRFRGLPVRIGHLSRLVPSKDQKLTREELQKGTCEIVIGTHALLGKNIHFRNLGLLVIDEEQHFGVSHKERLKKLRHDVHVLTLTATPIPRTLQLAMSGMRGLSLIATPPVDRLAVRTFILPMDSLVVREALLREHYRGGQSFYVCPRIADLKEIADFLKEHVPEVKFVVAHGQMPPAEIEDIMHAFYEGKYDVLLSTTIVESGLDIPTANTMVIHRADMFGLSQLYQLRGRVGRSKIRAYAYLTLPPRRIPTANAEKRLQVLQALDTLGAGFTIASHDMDIRGAGNLLGEEQSGHIKEVGLELYQQMLEEAVAQAKGGNGEAEDLSWSPQINVGAAVLIPEQYVPDLNLRMSLYRRLADLTDKQDIDAFGAELIDRFGPLPEEVEHLLKVILIKHYCREAGIEKIETGPKGAILSFRNDKFANPAGLIDFISNQTAVAKLRPDHRLVYVRKWEKIESRLKGSLNLARALAKIATE